MVSIYPDAVSPAASPGTRPVSPDGQLLEEAGKRLSVLIGEALTSSVSWEVDARIDRPRSSVFPMRAKVADDRVLGMAFYKVMLPSTSGGPDRHLIRVDRARTGLARAMALEDRLAATIEGDPIAFSRALAVDPESLTSVTIGVPGEPLGGLIRHLLTPSRARDAAGWMELTGRAARAIESCTLGEVDDREDERSDLIDRRFERLEGFLPTETVDRLRLLVEGLYREALAAEQPLIYAHGDFSPTNLLVDEGIGLIDFEWVPRLRVFDLANLVFRLEYETAMPTRAVRPLVEAALSGYGDSMIVASPQWRFHRISNLLKVVRDGPRPWYDRRSGRIRRALGELEWFTRSAQ